MKDTRVHQHVNQHACTGVPLLSWCLPRAGMSTCCQRSPLPGLALVFCGLLGGSRERRVARGGDLLLLLVTSCCPAQVVCSSCRQGCETQTFRAAAMPSLLQGRRAGAASEHLLCTEMGERACRGTGRGQELCVCKFYDETFTRTQRKWGRAYWDLLAEGVIIVCSDL